MDRQKHVSLSDIRVDTDYQEGDSGEKVSDALKRLEFERIQRLELIPTDDNEVRAALELLGQKAALDNESNRARRDRLSELLFQNPELKSKLQSSATQSQSATIENEIESEESDEEFYTPASDLLIESRQFLIQDSLKRARVRLDTERSLKKVQNVRDIIQKRRKLNIDHSSYELHGSQVVFSRPVSQVARSPDGASLAAGSWNGDVKILHPQSLEVVRSLDGAHDDKIGGVAWSSDSQLLATGGADNLVKIWNPQAQSHSEASRVVLRGHEARVSKVKFHPSDRFVASASFDMTWRLWDVERETELQLQEGHAKEVYCLDFQCDGSLLCSAGLDSVGHVWDMRTGRSLMVLEGHAKPIYGVSWSPNGHHVATGSGDGTVQVWDIRKANKPSSILAHNSIVSEVNFEKENGNFLVSSSYDRTIGVFATGSWIKLACIITRTYR